jgi:hypothetical protein
MFGVQVAVVAVTCLVAIVLLATSPWWMRALTALVMGLWHWIGRTDQDVVVGRGDSKDIIEGEFREVDK